MAQEFTDTQSMQVLQIASDVLYIVITCGDFDGKKNKKDEKVARKAIRTIDALIFFFFFKINKGY